MGIRISEFDTWQAGYAGATVRIEAPNSSTLISVYSDEALATPADNPQILSSLNQDDINFGKFSSPVYVGVAYQLMVNSTDETGIVRVPLTTLGDEDASDAVITVGTEERTLSDVLSELAIDALDYGELLPTSNPSYSASTNAATLAAAIGDAAADGGGYVLIPAGIYRFTSLTISPNVILKGKGDGVTFLQSVIAGTAVTLSGDSAGFEDITIDGVSNIVGSIGIYSKANDYTRFRRATVKRFETGVHCLGGKYGYWPDFDVSACAYGAKLHGDSDASNGANGDFFMHNDWCGIVSLCTIAGVELKYVDRKCWHNNINVGFLGNTGVGLRVFGARWTELGIGAYFRGNTTHLEVRDGTDTTLVAENTVIGLTMNGGAIVDGAMTFTGKCQDILFKRVEFSDGTYTLSLVDNNILALDCTEDADVLLAGVDGVKWTRARSILGDSPGSTGVTTGATATEAFSYTLAPGERAHFEAVVVAKARNTTDYAVYHIAQSAHRTGSTLAYQAQSANFTAGSIVTGAGSGATGRIVNDSDSGTTGTLTLTDLTGEFVNNEVITDELGGAAVANGTLAHQNAALLGSITSLETAIESNAAWACIFAVNAHEMQVLVTGAASVTVEWSPSVKITSLG